MIRLPRFHRCLPVIILLVVGNINSMAFAQTWISSTSGNWSQESNWSGGVPASNPGTVLGFVGSGNSSYLATNDIADPFNLRAILFQHEGTGSIALGGQALQFSFVNIPNVATAVIQQNSGSGSSGAAVVNNAISITSEWLSIQGAGGGDLTLAGQISGTRIENNSSSFSLFLTGGTGGTGLGELRANRGNTFLDSSTAFDFGFVRSGVFNGETANLTLRNATTSTASDQLQVGVFAGSTGSLLVTGAGSTWNQLGTTFIGNQGAGQLTVAESAQANFNNTVAVGADVGGSGTVSLLSSATGNFSASVILGQVAGSNGNFNMDGSATAVSSTAAMANFVVGREGAGNLTVTGGSSLTVGDAANVGVNDNELILGQFATGQGIASVSGTSSSIIASNLVVGVEGIGNFSVTDGALTNVSGTTALGYAATGTGTVLVAGSGSQLSTAQLEVGRLSTANSALTVSSGGVVDVGGTTFVAALSGSNGSLLVDGAGSTIFSNSAQIGGEGGSQGGVGSLSVTGGGLGQIASSMVLYDQGSLQVDSLSRVDIGLPGGQLGAVNVNAGGQLGGTGFVSADVRVGAGGALLPGLNSVGTLEIDGNLFMQSIDPLSRSIYGWEIADAGMTSTVLGGSSGLHDLIQLTVGNILLDNAQITLAEVSGFADTFDPTQSYSWSLMQIDGAGTVSLLNTTNLEFNGTSVIQSAVNGSLGNLSLGIGNAGGSNQFLALSYTAVPEPSSLVLCVAVASGVLLRRRRRLALA